MTAPAASGNLAETVLAGSGAAPDSIAVTWRDEQTPVADLREQVARAAGGLVARGVAPGDRVGVVCANNPTFVVAYLGALWAGAAVVPVNPMAPAEELARELGGTGAVAAIVGPAGRAATVEAAGSGVLADVTVVDAWGGGADVDGAGSTVAWDDLLASDPLDAAARSSDDPAVLAHTSGTSGAPKAAVLTHRNLAANLAQAQAHPTLHLEASDVVLGVLPLFHSYGLNAVMGLTLATGARLVLVERFDPHEVLSLIGDEGVTIVPGVPPMFSAWLGLPDASAASFASVRVALSGAAPLPVAVQEAFAERFGLQLHQGYGLTEAAPAVTTTGSEGQPRRGSIGVPLPGVEVMLADAAGEPVLTGDPGEIWVRGPNVFAGYWQDDVATSEVITADGWLRTGDIAVADDDGFLFVVDRSKDLVIVSGFNVYPAEVEEVLARHEGVAEVAVVGIPHPHTGEAVKAFVVPAPGARLDEDELVAFVQRSLARYKAPSAVEFVDHLPRGLAGKLLRRSLVESSGSGV